jgi:hypothetical protein
MHALVRKAGFDVGPNPADRLLARIVKHLEAPERTCSSAIRSRLYRGRGAVRSLTLAISRRRGAKRRGTPQARLRRSAAWHCSAAACSTQKRPRHAERAAVRGRTRRSTNAHSLLTAVDMRYYTDLCLRDRLADCGHQRSENCDVVTRRVNEDNSESEAAEVLLILQFAINGEKDVELLCGEPEQDAVLYSCPSGFRHRRNLIFRQLLA